MQSMEFSRPRILELVAVPSPGDLPNPGIEHRPPALQAGSLPAEPLGKPKNTGVGSLSLLLQIFLTQEVNPSLLHCRRIPYQLSYQGSFGCINVANSGCVWGGGRGTPRSGRHVYFSLYILLDGVDFVLAIENVH